MTAPTLVAVTTTTTLENTMAEIDLLTAEDVGRLFAQERARLRGEDPDEAVPFPSKTVWTYVHRSQEVWKNGKRGPYADNPIPAPGRVARAMVWRRGQRKALLTWYGWLYNRERKKTSKS